MREEDVSSGPSFIICGIREKRRAAKEKVPSIADDPINREGKGTKVPRFA